MSKGQTTSVSIPRFNSRTNLGEHLGLPSISKEREALIYFSIGLQLGGVDESDIDTWARAYSYAAKHTPDWVWDVLDPDIEVKKVIHKKMPFAEVATNARYMMAAIEKLLCEDKITLMVAMPHIAELKWAGSFPAIPLDSTKIAPDQLRKLRELNEMLSRLLDSWNRIKILGEGKNKTGTETLHSLQERFVGFQNSWNGYSGTGFRF